MSLGADVQAYLPEARAMAESRMSETVTVGTTSPGEFDPETGTYPDAITLHYPTPQDIFTDIFHDVLGDAGNGRARIKYPSMTVSEASSLGQVFSSQDVTLSIPVGLGLAIRIDDIVTVTASSADPGMVGRKFRIKGSAQAGQVTASRYPVEEVS